MSHHGDNPQEVQKLLNDAMKELLGEFPNGKLNDQDEGAIAFSVGVEAGKVVIRFPKRVAWIGMTGDEALQLAQDLIKHAKNAGITSPLNLRIG